MTDQGLFRRFFTDESEDIFSGDETQRLNNLLSNMSINDIPDSSLRDTESHLIGVLAMGAVEPSIKNKLEKLLEDIQEK